MKMTFDEFVDYMDEKWGFNCTRCVNIFETSIIFEKETDAGEDFSFSANQFNLIDDIINVANDFDINDHVYMWLDAKRNGVSGVPDVVTLVEDAKAIQEMLDDIATDVASKQIEIV